MEKKYSAVALGLFDGVHLGHRAVLKAAAEQKQQGLMPCAFTFPSESAAKKGTGGFIYCDDEKADILTEECGIERIYSPPFADICGMEGAEFAEEILHGELNAAFVCCGNDFRFGKGASCGTAELRSFGERLGFRVETVEDVLCGGERVSSTLIRRLLAEGRGTAGAEIRRLRIIDRHRREKLPINDRYRHEAHRGLRRSSPCRDLYTRIFGRPLRKSAESIAAAVHTPRDEVLIT